MYIKYKDFLNESNKTLFTIGDYKFTENELLKHKDSIVNWYGDFSQDSIDRALWTLYSVSKYYDEGGVLYRVVWLDDITDFDEKNIGSHFVEDKGQIYNIVEHFENHNYYDKNKEPYLITVKTPPKNVKIADDYFNNLNEEEIMVIDQTKLELISIEKYNRSKW